MLPNIPRYTNDITEDWLEEVLDELYEEWGELDVSERDNGYELSTGDVEFLVFEDTDEADEYAIEYEDNNFRGDPETYMSYLKDYAELNDLDNWASGMAEYILNEDDDTIKEQFPNAEIEDLIATIDELESVIYDLEEEVDMLEDDEDEIDLYIQKEEELSNRRDDLNQAEQDLENAINNRREEYYEEQKEYYEDNIDIDFLINEYGYTFEDLYENGHISIDFEDAAKNVVDTDGAAFVLAHYDHNIIEFENGAVGFRIN